MLNGAEGIPIELCQQFKSFESFKFLADNDGIVHFKQFQSLLNGISVEESSSKDNESTISVVAVINVWDKYFDLTAIGNLLREEWIAKLRDLDNDITETESDKIFGYMDRDKDGLIEKKDFILFSTVKLENVKEQEKLQNLLRVIQNIFTE